MSNITKLEPSDGIDQKIVETDAGVFQGSRGAGTRPEIAEQFGIKYILSITTWPYLLPIRWVYRWWLSVDDGQPWTHDDIEFVREFCLWCSTKRNVLIHCDHGGSRSAGAMIVWLMTNRGMERKEANEYLRSINPYANCHEKILNSLPERF